MAKYDKRSEISCECKKYLFALDNPHWFEVKFVCIYRNSVIVRIFIRLFQKFLCTSEDAVATHKRLSFVCAILTRIPSTESNRDGRALLRTIRSLECCFNKRTSLVNGKSIINN